MAKKYQPAFSTKWLTYHIQYICTKCCNQGDFSCEDDKNKLSEILFKEGWRTTDKNCYCPDCASEFIEELYPLNLNRP